MQDSGSESGSGESIEGEREGDCKTKEGVDLNPSYRPCKAAREARTIQEVYDITYNGKVKECETVMGKHPDLMVGLPTSTVFPTNDRKFEI